MAMREPATRTTVTAAAMAISTDWPRPRPCWRRRLRLALGIQRTIVPGPGADPASGRRGSPSADLGRLGVAHPVGRRPVRTGGGQARGRAAPLDGRQDGGRIHPVLVLLAHGQQRADHRGGQEMGHQAQVEQLGVRGTVVVLLLLHPRRRRVLDGGASGVLVDDHLGHLLDREGLRELIEDPELPAVGGVLTSQPHAGQRVEDVEHPAGLTARAVHRQRVASDGLHAESVEYGAEDAVVVEAGGEIRVEAGLLGLVAVHDALVEIGGPDAPDATGEHDVVAVVHLGQVVEGARLLRVGHDVGTARWVISMYPSSMSMFGVPYSPIVPSLTRWMSRFCSCLLYTSPSPRDRQKSRMP